jgi:gliding motility-associated-like protein
MNRIIRNIMTMLVGMAVWTLMPEEAHGQCKVDAGDPVKGQFSINGAKIQVNGDGNGVSSASNNIAIKICEGEVITLKSTLPVSSLSNVNYWITKLGDYNNLSVPPNNSASADGNYTTTSGELKIKMIDKATDSQGFSFYSTPGKYVITQYDYSTPTSSGTPNNHHACQVIEIIAPPKPVASVSTCSGGEFQVTIPVNANNVFDDYKVVFTPLSGTEETEYTGKKTLPFSLKKTLSSNPSNSNVIINISGETITGGCPNPPANNLGIYTASVATLFKPSLISIAGTTTKAEFNIELGAQNGTLWKFYRRDISDPLNYNGYTTDVKSVSSLVSSGTELVKVIVPDPDKMYCYQVAAVDAVCGSKELSNQEICTTPAKTTAENNQNVITWVKANGGAPAGVNPTPFINYEVDLLRVDGTVDQTLFASTDVTALSFTHKPLTCGQEYTYRVRTNYSSLSYSQIMKVKAISNDVPSKITKFFATMTNDNKNVSVQGQFDPTNTPLNVEPNGYKYYRSNSLTGTYSLQNTGNQIFKDLTTDANKQSYCYYMTWTNTCAKESEASEKVCTVFLKASGATTIWSRESPQSVGTDSYIVKKINPSDGTTIKDLATNLQSIYSFNTTPLPETEGQEIYIQIEARPTGWNTADPNRLPSSVSNIIKIFRPSFALSPQIFTPNGDNVNDKFIVEGKFIKNIKMTIYDRWGNPIFHDEQNGYPIQGSQSPNTVIGWDGVMNNGNKAFEGSYAFKIEIEDTIGQITVKEGALLLAY